MKKILLSLGSITLIATPITTLVSCGDSKKDATPATPMTMKEKVDNALGKLSNTVNSTKSSSQLSTNIGSKTANDPVEVSLLGLPNNYLVVDDGLSISYTINTAYDSSTKSVKLNVTISSIEDTSISSTKIITVRAISFDFSADKAKFNNPIVSTKTVFELVTAVGTTLTSLTAAQLGFTQPSLSNGVTATYSIENTTFSTTTPTIVTVHLRHTSSGLTDNTKTFSLTAKEAHYELSSTVKHLINATIIYSIVSDGQSGFFVGGFTGKLDHIDANGNIIDGWSTKTLINGETIHSIVSDGHGGAFVGGYGGKLDHIDASGNPVGGWTTKTLLGGGDIKSIISDGHNGFWVGGGNGKLNYITYS